MTDKYSLYARIFPVALAWLPGAMLLDPIVGSIAKEWFESEMLTAMFGKGFMYAALAYLLVQSTRFIGQSIVQRILMRDELDFPTTRWLIVGNPGISLFHQREIDKKLKRDFGVGLLPASLGDTDEVRRHNADLVGRVRRKVGSPPNLLNYNIQYGFARNLIGAAFPAFVFCAGIAIEYTIGLTSELVYHASLVIILVASILICFARQIIGRLGENYARALFQEYLNC